MKQNDSKAAEACKNNSRGGRPRTKPEEQRTVRMTAYFDPEGAKYVREFCKEHGRSTSSFLYDAAMDCKIVTPLSVEEGADLRRVAGMAMPPAPARRLQPSGQCWQSDFRRQRPGTECEGELFTAQAESPATETETVIYP